MSNPLCDDGRMKTKEQPAPVQAKPKNRSSRRMARDRNETSQAVQRTVLSSSAPQPAGELIPRPSIPPMTPFRARRPAPAAGPPRTAFVRPIYSRTSGIQVLYGLSTVKKGLIRVNTTLQLKNGPLARNNHMNKRSNGRMRRLTNEVDKVELPLTKATVSQFELIRLGRG